MGVLRNQTQSPYTVVVQSITRDKTLSLKGRGLLVTLMSLPDNWKYSERGLQAIIPTDGQTSIRSAVKELEALGYLHRSRERLPDGSWGDAIWEIREIPVKPDADEQKTSEEPTCENRNLDNSNLDKREQYNNKEYNTKKLITNESLPSPFTPTETMPQTGGRKDVEEAIKENIEYDALAGESPGGVVDDIVGLMVDTVTSSAPTIRINGTRLPTDDVRRRYMALGHDHARYVIDTLMSGKSKILNVRAYLLTALYNAPMTMRSYYQAEAASDLAGKDDG